MNLKPTEDISFGEWVRQRRHILDLTQQELADQVGCARITLRRIEAGALKPSKELALILLEKLGAPSTEREAWLQFARGLSRFSEESAESIVRQSITNLPASLTSFIGREKEQAEIKKLIAKYRLVTLTGAGGIGKTRLSIQVASTLLNNFPNGTWLVELAPLADAAFLPQVVLTTLGLSEQTSRSPLQILTDFLQAKRALLILDNCEHLIMACAQLSHDLLTRCPSLQILATSREPLNISGEAIWQVSTFPLPSRETWLSLHLLRSFESIRLFVERAKAVKSGFELTEQNATSIAQICHQLDGIPLAIELAAVRIRMMTAEEIELRLDNRLDLLKQSSRVAIPHHQTLRAAINWSYELLDEKERVLFRRLSVFTGSWTLESAESICPGESLERDDIFSALSHLVDKSLVNVETDHRMSRFQMLDTIHEYAREKLVESGESEALYRSHLKFFTDWAQHVESKLHGPEQIFWMDQIEMEHDNLRSALQWAVRNDVEKGLQLAGALGWFWFTRGYPSEGIEWLTKLIAYDIPQSEEQFIALGYKGMLSLLTGDIETVRKIFTIGLQHLNVASPRTKAWTLRGNAIFRAASGRDLQSAIALAEQAVNLSLTAGDDWHYGMSLFALGDIYLHGIKDFEMAKPIHEKSLEVLRGIGDKFGIAHVLLSLRLNYLRQGNYARAAELETEALGLLRELGNKTEIGWTLANLYHLARFQGDYERAQFLAEERLSLWRHLGVDLQTAWAIYDLGRIAILQDKPGIAASHFKESILLFQQKGNLKDKILCLIGPAHLFLAQGKVEPATRLFAAFQNLCASNQIELERADRAEVEGLLKTLKENLEEPQFGIAWWKGEKMSLDEALGWALKTLEEI